MIFSGKILRAVRVAQRVPTLPPVRSLSFLPPRVPIPASNYLSPPLISTLSFSTTSTTNSEESMRKTYTLMRSAHSAAASAEAVWKVWTDVSNWPAWDVGLTKCTAPTAFTPGQVFELTPKTPPGVPVRTLTTRLLLVEPNRCFIDSTDVPFGNVQVEHSVISSDDGGVVVAHKITAQIKTEQISDFEKTLWAKWNTGLEQSVQNVLSLAEKFSKAHIPRNR